MASIAMLAAAPTAVAPTPCPAAAFAGGTGDPADPFLVATETQLRQIGTSPSCLVRSFRQVQDIELHGPFAPIGVVSSQHVGAFSGSYDGGGHSITGLDVPPVVTGSGLFGATAFATIERLSVSGQVANGGSPASPTGLVVGEMYGGTLRDVSARGLVSGTREVGGLIGLAEADPSSVAEVSRITANVDVSASDPSVGNAGGLVGLVRLGGTSRFTIGPATTAGTVSGSTGIGGVAGALQTGDVQAGGDARITLDHATASTAVSGTSGVGGLVGTVLADFTSSITISDSSASGSVTGTGQAVGGAAGAVQAYQDARATLARIATTGRVAGDSTVGGLVGVMDSDGPGAGGTELVDSRAAGQVVATTSHAAGTVGAAGATYGGPLPQITRVYAVGAVSGPSRAAGLVNLIQTTPPAVPATVTASFWDTQTTGQSEGGNPGGLGRTTAQLKDIATFTAPGISWPITRGWVASDPANGKVWGICPEANGGMPFLLGEYSTNPCAVAPAPVAPTTVGTIPGVKWRSRGTTVAANFRTVPGASRYSIVASRTAPKKAGKMSTARVQSKAGTCRTTKGRVACAIRLAPGRWKVTLRASSPTVLVATASRTFTLRALRVTVTG